MKVYSEILKDSLKIIFLHVPRTGGTTFRNILKNQFDDPYVYGLGNPNQLNKLSKMPPEDITAFDIITGHFPYYSLPDNLIPKRFRWFTWLRDPVERVISMYNYWSGKNRQLDVRAQKLLKDESMTLDDFINSKHPEHKYYIFAYLTHFSDRFSQNGSGVDIERYIEQSARNLLTNFEFIGITELFDDGLKYLKDVYGFNIIYKSKNLIPIKDKTEVTDKQRERLKSYLKPEYIIYDLAKEAFERRVNGHS